MDAVITALTGSLTPAVFFGIVADLVPFLVVIIPVSLSIYFLRRLIRGAGKGKTTV